MSALVFNTQSGASFCSPTAGVTGFFQNLGEQPGLVLKTTETLAHWARVFSEALGNRSAALAASNFAAALSLGEKGTAFPGALGASGRALADLNKTVSGFENMRSNRTGSVREFSLAGLSALSNTATALAKVAEFRLFLQETRVIPNVGWDSPGLTIQSLKIITDLVGIVESGDNIAKVITTDQQISKKVQAGETVPDLERQIHEMKRHESWLGMVKNISSLALRILSCVGIIFGVAFANPILLAIGTVVLATSIALFFIRDNRKALEGENLAAQINKTINVGK